MNGRDKTNRAIVLKRVLLCLLKKRKRGFLVQFAIEDAIFLEMDFCHIVQPSALRITAPSLPQQQWPGREPRLKKLPAVRLAYTALASERLMWVIPD